MEKLGERLARGDAVAFAEFYDAFADRLHHYLTVCLQSRNDADDVLQETFLRLVRTRQRLAEVTNLGAFVFTISRNEAARYARCRKRHNRARSPLTAVDLFQAVPDNALALEQADLIMAALAALNGEQREVVELKVYGGLTFEEIGEVTGVPMPTAATRYRAALDRMRSWLTKQPQ